jgi:MSHA biogenesis protein MshL
MNGQPALLSVGKDVAYIKEVSSDVNNDTGTVTYTAETDSVVEGIALGVMPSILDDDSVVLHLTPITTDLVNNEIPYREFGQGLSVGLPQVQIREMSTMVQVNNGEMLIIGGLIDSAEGTSGSFAPVVGDIPFLRYLFGVEEKRLEKRELVILLTPKII